jgi:hypothetical protein
MECKISKRGHGTDGRNSKALEGGRFIFGQLSLSLEVQSIHDFAMASEGVRGINRGDLGFSSPPLLHEGFFSETSPHAIQEAPFETQPTRELYTWPYFFGNIRRSLPGRPAPFLSKPQRLRPFGPDTVQVSNNNEFFA